MFHWFDKTQEVETSILKYQLKQSITKLKEPFIHQRFEITTKKYGCETDRFLSGGWRNSWNIYWINSIECLTLWWSWWSNFWLAGNWMLFIWSFDVFFWSVFFFLFRIFLSFAIGQSVISVSFSSFSSINSVFFFIFFFYFFCFRAFSLILFSIYFIYSSI